MSEIICQVGDRAGRVEFVWSTQGGYFRPYSVADARLIELREAAEKARLALESLVRAQNSGEGPIPPEESIELAEAGFRMFNALLPPEDETAGKVRRWLEDQKKRPGLIGLEVVVDVGSALSIPWNLIYDERPAKYKKEFQTGEGEGRWRPFWSVRYNLTSGRRVDPLRRRPIWREPRVVVVVDPEVHSELGEAQKSALDGFLAEMGLQAVGSMDELEAALEAGFPRLLYWMGHASPEYLLLGDEQVRPSDLLNLMRSFADRERPEGMLAFLNACETAEAGHDGSFLDVLHEFGFAGAIATEQRTIDTFANEFGLAFLRGFLKEGKPLGELLHGLRLQSAPMGLIYGVHCPPEIRVHNGPESADVPAAPAIRESGPVAGAMLGVPEKAARKRRRKKTDREPTSPEPVAPPPLPEEPYRSLAFFDERDRTLFTGRDADVLRFSASLDLPDTRIMILHSESGVGKSSFLRAGLIPYLEYECVGYRFFRRDDGSPMVVQASRDPTGQVAQALIEASATSPRYRTPHGEAYAVDLRTVLDEEVGAKADFEGLREALHRDVSLFAKVLARMAARLPHALVLVLDQAEEIFTLARTPEEVDGRNRFLKMLQHVADVSADVKVIVSLRTEYYGRLLDHLRDGRRDLVGLRDDLLRDFSRSALIEAIARPTSETPIAPGQPSPREVYGVRFEEGLPGAIADGLLALRSENQDSVLPLMQVICTQLYERVRSLPASERTITRAGFDSIRGVEGGLRAFAEDALTNSLGLDPGDRESFKTLFGRLCNRQPDGTLTTWMMPREDLERLWDRPPPFAGVFEAAKSVRLLREDELRIEGAEARRYVRLGHDALAKVAAAWKAEAEEKERLDEVRRKRRAQVRRLAIGLAASVALAALFGFLGIVALLDKRELRRTNSDLASAKKTLIKNNEGLIVAKEEAEAQKKVAEDQKKVAEDQKKEVEAQKRVAQSRLNRSIYDQAGELLRSEPFRLRTLLAAVPEADRDFLWHYHEARTYSVHRLEGLKARVEMHCFSPVGQTLATVSVPTVNHSRMLNIWDLAEGTRKLYPKFPLAVDRLSFSPDGRLLAGLNQHHAARGLFLWDVKEGKLLRTLPVATGMHSAFRFLPDGKTLVVVAADLRAASLKATYWDVETGRKEEREVRPNETEGGEVSCLGLSLDGKTLAMFGSLEFEEHVGKPKKGAAPLIAAHTGHPLNFYDLEENQAGVSVRRLSFPASCLAFSPDGKTIAAGSIEHTIGLWGANVGDRRGMIPGLEFAPRSVEFSGDGKFIAASGETKSGESLLTLWDGKTLGHKASFRGLGKNSNSPLFDPDSRTIAVNVGAPTPEAGWSVNLWELSKIDDWTVVGESTSNLDAMSLSPDGKTLASSARRGSDQSLLLWDVNSPSAPRRLQVGPEGASAPAFRPDGHVVAMGTGSGIKSWVTRGSGIESWADGPAAHSPRDPSNPTSPVAFNPDGKTLASGEASGKIRLWDGDGFQPLGTLEGPKSPVRSLCFSPAEKSLVAGSEDGTIRWWDPAGGRALDSIRGHDGPVVRIKFGPDGKTFASVGEHEGVPNEIKIWDPATRKPLGPPLIGNDIAFSPDGKSFVTVEDNDQVTFWDLKSREKLGTLRQDKDTLTFVEFTRDGRRLVAAGRNAIVAWDAPTDAPGRATAGPRGSRVASPDRRPGARRPAGSIPPSRGLPLASDKQ